MDAMRKVQKNYGPAFALARKLKEYNLQQFSEQKQVDKFIEIIFGFSPQVKIINKNKEPQKFNSISFCISTNGKKESVTKMQIRSILNNIKNIIDNKKNTFFELNNN